MSDVRSSQRWVLGLFLIGLAFSITLSQLALALLVVFWLLRFRDAAARAAMTFPLAAPFLAFAAASLLAALGSGNIGDSLLHSKALLLALAFFALVNTLRGADDADWFLSRFLLLMAAVSLWSVAQVSFCPQEPWSGPILSRVSRKCFRARGFYSIYMTLAGVLTLTFLAALPRVLAKGPDRRWWMAPGWVVSGLALVLTYTRGAWLGVLAGAAGLALLLRRVAVVGAVGGVLVLALLLFQAGTLQDRLRSLGDPADPTFRERLYMWQSGWAIALDHPLTGVGPGQVKPAFPRYARPEAMKKTTSHVHNTPLQILAERGLLGLAAWLWIWIAFFVHAGRILRRLGADQTRARGLVAGSLAAVVGFLVGGLSEFNFGDSEVSLAAYALMALPFVIGVRPE
ncbi:MAG: O-antigen ligase family protein [Candidatus Rokubacteria bacterium]|nr:O-antigen ligase family protein [Candidatus Rokubacteria bacterium]